MQDAVVHGLQDPETASRDETDIYGDMSAGKPERVPQHQHILRGIHIPVVADRHQVIAQWVKLRSSNSAVVLQCSDKVCLSLLAQYLGM